MSRQHLSLAVLGLSLACASTEPAPQVAPFPAAPTIETPAYLEERALLLLLADQKTYEPFAVTRFLEAEPVLRKALTITLGRIGSPRSRPALETLIGDPVAEIRQEAAFALGLLGEVEAVASLRNAASDADPDTGRVAVEALAKLEVPLIQVIES
ncbi:unnamed protein product, partial [marine sediment metagenome]